METAIIKKKLSRGDTLFEPLQFEIDTGNGFVPMDLTLCTEIKITLRKGQNRTFDALYELELGDGIEIDPNDSSMLKIKLKPSETDIFNQAVIYGDIKFFLPDTVPEDDRFTYASIAINVREDI